jgi:hypothetical protein
VLLDGGLTAYFDQTGSLLLGLAWLSALAVLAAWLFRRGPFHPGPDRTASLTVRGWILGGP